MSAERSVGERARLHAALADPARVRMVDHLVLSDATPGELRELVGMPSNLVAHHLRVLEEAGLVARRRSQGDRRRSYVQLRAEILDDLLPAPPPTRGISGGRVLFVCTANSARSQLAAARWRDASDVPAGSAGTRPAERVAAGAVAVARRRRLPLRQVRPRRLDTVITGHELVVTVCDEAHEELQRTGPVRPELHWSVPDPVREGSDEAFEHAYDELADRVTRLAARVERADPARGAAS